MFQNLLSKERKKELAVEYKLRTVNVMLYFFALGIVVGMVALFPSYMHVKGEMEQKEKEYSDRQAEVEANKKLSEELEEYSYRSYVLKNALEQRLFSDVLHDVVERRPEGVTLVGFSYDQKEDVVTLKGIASTREIVMPFVLSLEQSEYFESVSRPFADLEKDVDLPFTLTMRMYKVQ